MNVNRSANVTMINLTILPDWNSLDSMRRAHSDLEAAGLLFFALLVLMEALAHTSKDDKRKHLLDTIGIWFFAIAIVCEIAGYKYGQRNDDLSGEKIKSLDTEAGDALKKASDAHTLAQSASDIAKPAKETADTAKGEADAALTKLGIVQIGVDTANATLADIQSRIAWRSISDEQKKTLEYWLRDSRGESITVTWEEKDPEVNIFALSLVSALQDAGLTVHPAPVSLEAVGSARASILYVLIEGDPTINTFVNRLATALVCSSLARAPIQTLRSTGRIVTLEVRPRNPTPLPPFPLGCTSVSASQ